MTEKRKKKKQKHVCVIRVRTPPTQQTYMNKMRAADTQLELDETNTQLTDSSKILSTQNVFKFLLRLG